MAEIYLQQTIKMISGIYKLSWTGKNEYFYFGQSQNIHNRKGQHFRHLKNGTHDNDILQKLYRKYGIPDFEIIISCSVEELNNQEQTLLDKWCGYKFCCNICPSADGRRGWKRTEATREKNRIHRLGVALSKNHRENISVGLIDAFKSGRRVQPKFFGKENHFFAKSHSDETLRLMKGKSKGIGDKNNRARITLNLLNGIFYGHAGEAAESMNINPQYLRRMLNGDRHNKTNFVYA